MFITDLYTFLPDYDTLVSKHVAIYVKIIFCNKNICVDCFALGT
jgi:hypothetical protein